MNWLATIGGVKRVLSSFVAMFFGGYIQFTSNIEVMKMLYGCTTEAKDISIHDCVDYHEGGEEKNHHKEEPHVISRIDPNGLEPDMMAGLKTKI